MRDRFIERVYEKDLEWLEKHCGEYGTPASMGYYLGYIAGCAASNDDKRAAGNVFSKVLHGATPAEQESADE